MSATKSKVFSSVVNMAFLFREDVGVVGGPASDEEEEEEEEEDEDEDKSRRKGAKSAEKDSSRQTVVSQTLSFWRQKPRKASAASCRGQKSSTHRFCSGKEYDSPA